MKEKWDERYSHPEYAYGQLPNRFLEEKLAKLPVGTILFPAEGEGRNAVYAAKLGWQVSAFDISSEGQKKAKLLADKHNVSVAYSVGELSSMYYLENSFDAIALIYAHFPGNIKSDCHKKLVSLLRPGGTLIFEAFSKKHLAYVTQNEKVGGPKDLATLFSIEELMIDFNDFDFEELSEQEIKLNEGQYHIGLGHVIRFVAKKK